ncbi:MAG TPA: 2-hydroxychromene-2-carboxylate isomerase [Roseiarcus sp.]|nr:2-hydroxychromene-2-carboxylate isomerase [Roseiarcus sp.]
MSRRIDYFFSLVSPWAYIGHRLFVGLARRHGADIAYRPVALNEVFAETGGLPLAKRHPARQAYRMVELQRWREKRGLKFHLRPKHWPFDANLANCAVLAIVQAGGDPAGFAQSAFAAIWEHEDNLGDRAVLARLVGDAGFDAAKILAAAQSAEILAAYDRNRVEAIALGAFGSPCYVLNGEVFWGQDRLELLDDALKSGRPPYSATPAA